MMAKDKNTNLPVKVKAFSFVNSNSKALSSTEIKATQEKETSQVGPIKETIITLAVALAMSIALTAVAFVYYMYFELNLESALHSTLYSHNTRKSL